VLAAKPSSLQDEIAQIKAELAIAEAEAAAEAEAEALRPLAPRQEAFVREYLLDSNGAAAAIRSGYSPNAAAAIATRLLNNANVAAAVATGKAQRLSRTTLQGDVIVQELATLALSNVKHYVITDEGEVTLAAGAPPNAFAAIQSIDRTTTEKEDPKTGEITRTYNVKLKLWDKPNPLKLLGKHAGIASFADRVEITGRNGGPIEIAAVKLAELPLEALRQKMLELVEAPVDAEIVQVTQVDQAAAANQADQEKAS
jgi:phage terminase small subunit